MIKSPQSMKIFPLPTVIHIQMSREKITQHTTRSGPGTPTFFPYFVVKLVVVSDTAYNIRTAPLKIVAPGSLFKMSVATFIPVIICSLLFWLMLFFSIAFSVGITCMPVQ